MLKRIVLLRHVESEKNVKRSFSSSLNKEQPTKVGLEQAKVLSKCIVDFAEKFNLDSRHIYAANSERARVTASVLAEKLTDNVTYDDSFLSVTTDESIKGKTEDEIAQTNPTFINELNMYRCGLFNAYLYSSVADTIKSGEYENKVITAFKDHLINGDEKLKVFVLHHSSLTAVLIHIARHMGVYPQNYYGKVESDLGNLYLVEYDDVEDAYKFILGNTTPNQLLLLKKN